MIYVLIRRDIGNPNAVEMRKDLNEFWDFTAPGVEMHCLYGKNVGDTVERFVYVLHSSNRIQMNDFFLIIMLFVNCRLDFGPTFNPNPSFVKGEGDGTVNRRSLIGCGYWENTASQGNHAVYQQEFPGVEHYNMLSNAGPINYIIDKLTGVADYPLSDELSGSEHIMKIRLF